MVADIPRLRLTLGDRQTLAEACGRLAIHDIVSQTEDFVIEAQVQAGRLSFELRRALLEFGAPVTRVAGCWFKAFRSSPCRTRREAPTSGSAHGAQPPLG